MLKECKEVNVKLYGKEIESIREVGHYTRKNLKEEEIGYEIYFENQWGADIIMGYVDVVNPQNSWTQNRNLEITLTEQIETNTKNKQGIILNYTPHTVNIIDAEGNKTQDYPSAGEARCKQSTVVTGSIGDIPITSTTFGEVEGLPEEEEGVYYIVSRLIRQALPNREDLLVPNEMVRDDVGRIIGCKSLANN